MARKSGGIPANDAGLIQAVKSAFGRDEMLRRAPKPNVSSCKMVVTLHGVAGDEASKERAEEVSRSVVGVEGVINKLRCNHGAARA